MLIYNYETSYTYDILGRLTEVYNEGTLKSSYSYYIDGTLKEQDLGGFVTTYYYKCAKQSLAVSVGENLTQEKASHHLVTVGLRPYW